MFDPNAPLVVTAFQLFVLLHILAGSIGLITFWVPVVGRKGGRQHKRWGLVFTRTMLATGAAALGISACTLIDPVATHPHLPDAEWVRGIGLPPPMQPALRTALATTAHRVDAATRKATTQPSWQTITDLAAAHQNAADTLREWLQARNNLHTQKWLQQADPAVPTALIPPAKKTA